MVPGQSPDELPPGWKEHVKDSNGRKIKLSICAVLRRSGDFHQFYIDETGLKFNSKKRVIEFVQTKIADQSTPQSKSDHDQKSSCSKSKDSPSQVVVEENSTIEWLPKGWIIESRYRKSGAHAGSVYKIYVDPLSGSKFYSKPQVLQHLERVNFSPTPEKQQKEVEGDNSSKQDAPKHCESKSQSLTSGKKQIGLGKPAMENVCREISWDDSPKQDPPQHGKCIIGNNDTSGKEGNGLGKPFSDTVYHEVTVDNSSKEDSSKCYESTNGNNQISGKEETRMGKPSLEIVPVESKVIDDLPPGWIKEIRPRKQGKRMDPFYIDPMSGYEFRSKRDALRYLEFGDISRCAITPKKREGSDLKPVDHEVSTQPDGKELEQVSGGRRRVSSKKAEGCGRILRSAVATPESDRLLEIKGDNKPTDAKISTSKVNVVQGRQLRSGFKRDRSQESPQSEFSYPKVKAIRDNGAVSNITATFSHAMKQPETESSNKSPNNDRYADANITSSSVDSIVLQICSELNNCDKLEDTSYPTIEGSRLDVKVDVKGAASSSATALLHEQKLLKVHLDPEVQPKKSKKRKAPSTPAPARSSKRLSGKEPELRPDIGLSERALRAAVRKPDQTETHVSSNLAQNSAVNGEPQETDSQPQKEIIEDMGSGEVALQKTELLNNIEKPLQEQAIQEQAVGQLDEGQKEENPRSQDSQFWYPFGDSFSDPCLEFAFKTLTGEIPLEDTLAFPGCFQQEIGTSFTQANSSMGLPEIDKPALFQNDVPLHHESVQQHVSREQPLPKSTTPPGNINLPSCSSFGSQQPGLGSRSKDYETKVNS